MNDDVRHKFLHAYHLAMSFGDISFGYFGFVGWLYTGFYLDTPLSDIHKRTRSVVAEGREYESSTLLIFILSGWQLLLNLSGDSKNPDPRSLVGEAFDDDFTMEMKAINSKPAFFVVRQCEMILGYTYEDWDVVRKNLPLIRRDENESKGYFSIAFNYIWTAVCHYDLYRANGRRKDKKEGRRAHNKVKEWATTGTVMLWGANKWLAAMESLCIKKAPLNEVENLFEEAFVALSENKNRYFEALANERLARLYLADDLLRDETKGCIYLDRAIGLYRRWGASAKVEWLETRYNRSAMLAEGAVSYLT
mmetsp:Transcript_24586/g.40707  ORF Transcript_24586/g.40707 Transcript_24586/m.40707 type:complete len:307 (+) Transcript_24586:11-931(+)